MTLRGENLINMFKCEKRSWILVFSVIISGLFTFSFIQLHTPLGWLVTSPSQDNIEYDLLIMSVVDRNTADIDSLKNWTSLFTSERVRLLFFVADDIDIWTKLFPTIDVIQLNNGMMMCKRQYLTNLKAVFELAREKYRSHFYAYLNRNVMISSEIGQTINNLIRDYRDIVRKKPMLILARSRVVENKNMALQVLNSQLSRTSTEVKYTIGRKSDVFITNRQFEWSNIPWMLAEHETTSKLLTALSRQRGVILLDVTKSSNVIRTRKKKHNPRPPGHIMRCVKNMLIESHVESEILDTCGSVMCVSFETNSSKEGIVVINRKVEDECNDCNFLYKPDVSWLPQ